MTSVTVSPGLSRGTYSHDLSLTDGTTTIGLKFSGAVPNILQKIPISDGKRLFNEIQKSWTGGRGRKRYRDDPTGYFDAKSAWTMTDGKLFPVPQWRFAKGFRVADYAWGGSLVWKKLYTGGDALYISRSFTVGTTGNKDYAMLRIRRVGSPGTLTFKLAQDNAGSPGTVLQTVTKTTGDVPDFLAVDLIFDWSGTQSLTAATTYHLYIYGAVTDNASNHWEVGADESATGSKTSADGSSWSSPADAFGLYFRIVEADAAQQLRFFYLEGALYAVTIPDGSGNSQLYINGDRGTATSATSTTLTDSNSGVSSGWSTDQWAGAYVRIIAGTGDGQVRQIASNTSTTLTVAAWDITPSTDSRYVIYATDTWQEITGHGLGKVVSRPATINAVTYFPQGASVNIRRMRNNASSHDFAADGTNKADYMTAHPDPSIGLRMWKALKSACTVHHAAAVAWGSALAFTAITRSTVGATDYQITGLHSLIDKLYITKEDNLWYMDGTVPKIVTSGAKYTPDATNGVAMGALDNMTYFGWGNSVTYMVGTESKDLMNYRTGYDGMPSDRKGYPSRIETVLGWVFVAYDGGTGNYSSVLVYNGINWMELWRGWKTGLRVRDLWYQSCPGTRGRLWIDAGGEAVYIDLPQNAANPLLDSGLPLEHEFSLVTGTFDLDKETFYKLFKELRVTSENLSGTSRFIEVDYQLDDSIGSSTWTVLGTMNTSPLDTATLDLGAKTRIRFRLRCYSNSQTTPVIITSTELAGWLASPLKSQWLVTCDVSNRQITYDGQEDHDPDDIVNQLTTWATQATKLTMRQLNDTFGDNVVVTVEVPVPVMDWVNEGDWGGRISLAIREA